MIITPLPNLEAAFHFGPSVFTISVRACVLAGGAKPTYVGRAGAGRGCRGTGRTAGSAAAGGWRGTARSPPAARGRRGRRRPRPGRSPGPGGREPARPSRCPAPAARSPGSAHCGAGGERHMKREGERQRERVSCGEV